MNGWEIDALVEADRARAWEELNAPDPFEKQMKDASSHLFDSASFLSIAEDRLTDAYYALEGTPMQEKISEYIEKISDIRCEFQSLANKYERGERE